MALPTWAGVGAPSVAVGDIAPALPAGWAAGDIFLCYVETDDEAVTASAGWSEVPGSPQVVAGSVRLTTFWRRAVGGDVAPTISGVTNHKYGIVVGVRGCRTSGDPWDFIGADGSAIGASIGLPGGTTTVADCLIVGCIADGTDSASSTRFGSHGNASLASITERYDAGTTTGNGGGLGVFTGEKAVAGVVNTTTVFSSLSSPAMAGFQIALTSTPLASAFTPQVIFF